MELGGGFFPGRLWPLSSPEGQEGGGKPWLRGGWSQPWLECGHCPLPATTCSALALASASVSSTCVCSASSVSAQRELLQTAQGAGQDVDTQVPGTQVGSVRFPPPRPGRGQQVPELSEGLMLPPPSPSREVGWQEAGNRPDDLREDQLLRCRPVRCVWAPPTPPQLRLLQLLPRPGPAWLTRGWGQASG